MPLSDHEQRILAEIERRLLEEDPKFAHHVGSTFQAHLARRLKLAAFAFVVGLVVLVAGFAKNVGLGVAGFVIMLVAIFEFVRTLRRRASVERPQAAKAAPGPQAPPQRPSSPTRSVQSWWGRMTERWRQRWEERGGPPPP
jgi:Protein of unknown function (DUF3040)